MKCNRSTRMQNIKKVNYEIEAVVNMNDNDHIYLFNGIRIERDRPSIRQNRERENETISNCLLLGGDWLFLIYILIVLPYRYPK